jgi:SHS family lactate transporter-like MFS transporter
MGGKRAEPAASARRCSSHGTQYLYPTFLKSRVKFEAGQVTTIATVYNVGTLLGGLFFSFLSQPIGRRVALVTGSLLTPPGLPVGWPGLLPRYWLAQTMRCTQAISVSSKL